MPQRREGFRRRPGRRARPGADIEQARRREIRPDFRRARSGWPQPRHRSRASAPAHRPAHRSRIGWRRSRRRRGRSSRSTRRGRRRHCAKSLAACRRARLSVRREGRVRSSISVMPSERGAASTLRLLDSIIPRIANIAFRSRGAKRPGRERKFRAKRRGRRGVPGARCTRGLVCKVHKGKRTRAYRFSGGSLGIPCAMALRLMARSPRRRIRLVTVIGELAILQARLYCYQDDSDDHPPAPGMKQRHMGVIPPSVP